MRTAGGWAEEAWPQEHLISHIPDGTDPDAVRTAFCDWWEQPHSMALTPADVDALRDLAGSRPPDRPWTGNGAWWNLGDELDPALRQAILDRMLAANQAWWRVDVTDWKVAIKRYRAGDEHGWHQDWHPGVRGRGGRCKLVATGQLSDGDDYDGGDLLLSAFGHEICAPVTAGTLVTFPSWTRHRVEPVTDGERWALIVDGFGPPLR